MKPRNIIIHRQIPHGMVIEPASPEDIQLYRLAEKLR